MAADLRDPVRFALESVLDEVRPRTDGEVASYIPELARVDPERLGAALASTRGVVHEAGDCDVKFTIQSVSKPFVFALALDQLGLVEVTRHLDLEPSGEPFNAISLDEATGRPMNPMINAGAIVTTSLIRGDTSDDKFAVVLAGLEAFAGRQLSVDEQVFTSEASTGDRNRALAYLTRSAGTLRIDGRGRDDGVLPAVLDLGQRARPRDHGGDAGQRRRESGHRRDRSSARMPRAGRCR